MWQIPQSTNSPRGWAFALQEHLKGVQTILEMCSCSDWILPQPFAVFFKQHWLCSLLLGWCPIVWWSSGWHPATACLLSTCPRCSPPWVCSSIILASSATCLLLRAYCAVRKYSMSLANLPSSSKSLWLKYFRAVSFTFLFDIRPNLTHGFLVGLHISSKCLSVRIPTPKMGQWTMFRKPGNETGQLDQDGQLQWGCDRRF